MPYTTELKQRPYTVLRQQVWPKGQYRSQQDYVLVESHIQRTGSKASPPAAKWDHPKPQKIYKEVVVTLPLGPRLPYKIWKIRKGRRVQVWARQPIQVRKLIRVPWPKSSKKPKKGLKLAPNNLTFNKVTVSSSGSSSITGTHLDEAGWYDVMSGNLINAATVNNESIGLDFYNYFCNKVITTSKFADARTKASNAALTSLYEKVGNQKINLAQALAERRQTADMILELVTRLARALLALKRGQLSNSFKQLFPGSPSKQAANDWLILQYGIKPLVQDILGAMKMMAEPEDQEFDIIAGKTVRVDSHSIYDTVHTRNCCCAVSAVSEGSVSVKWKVRVRVSHSAVRDLSRLGFDNPFQLGWELVPWSFVVDWLIPIGDYLAGQSAFTGLTVVSCHETTFMTEDIVYKRDYGGVDGRRYRWTSASCKASVKKVNCYRAVKLLPSIPLPSFKDPVSTGHIMNALALLRQLKH